MKIKTIAHFVIVTLVLILAPLDLRIWKRITNLYIISNEGNHVQFGWLTDHKMCWLDKKDAFLTLEVETLLRWNPLMKRKYKSNINDVHGHVWILKCDAPSHNPGCLSGKVKHAIKKNRFHLPWFHCRICPCFWATCSRSLWFSQHVSISRAEHGVARLQRNRSWDLPLWSMFEIL